MPVGSSNAPFIQQMLIQAYFVAKLAKKKEALMGRFSSKSLDLSSIFSTTDKTWKELVKGEKCPYKCWHFPAKMSCLRSFCREIVKNGICALWWAGLTQKVNGEQVRWFWGRAPQWGGGQQSQRRGRLKLVEIQVEADITEMEKRADAADASELFFSLAVLICCCICAN